jgi:hypothetical protein
LGLVVLAQAQAQEETWEGALEWPRAIETKRGTITMYQPQTESFRDNVLESRAAVSLKATGGAAPVFGAVWISSRMSTDYDERLVTLVDLKVTAAKVPDVAQEQVDSLATFLEEEIPTWNVVIALDRLLADLDGADVQFATSDELRHDPPVIYFRTEPTVLVMVDGDPIQKEIEGSTLKYVVNTPYFMLFDESRNTYYLKGGDFWYSSRDVKEGWGNLSEPPKDVSEIAKKAEDAAKEDASAEASSPDTSLPQITEPPGVIVATEPAELLQSDGEPDFASIEGTQLLYVKNSESDIIMDITTQQYYVLISGRWFRSASLENGPWRHEPPDELPVDFAAIPPESDLADVLPSVAGTQQAKEAVLENTIPQTAEVDRSQTLTVAYDGDPKFEKIDGTSMQYAVNTDKSVLLIDGAYYCCDEAVWYVSKTATGPYSVSAVVPESVQDIPPESPVYNVKYVYIYDTTPEVVYVGYTPAYMGAYYYNGCVVYGTGWWYRPVYPVYYYPRPVTYGFGIHYNPWTGWGCSFGVSYGWLTIGFHTGGYHRGYWGPAGYRHGYRHGYARGYYHGRRAGYAAGYRAGQRHSPTHRNMYSGRQGVRTSQRPAAGQPATRPTTGGRPATGATGRASAATGAARSPRATQGNNNVYSDRNGNVYRQQGSDWQKRDNKSGSWNAAGGSNRSSSGANRSSTAGRSQNTRQSDLNRSAQSRQRGSQRSQSYSQSRSGGGGSRGGGGGRRR